MQLDYINDKAMPVPKYILQVKRPMNTLVTIYGKNHDHYAVRQRVGCKRINGRNIPQTGPTVGHIIDGVYVPKNASTHTSVSVADIDLKDWGNVMLCKNVFEDIIPELMQVYDERDSLRLFVISILRVCNPGIKDYELKEAYETSFLSELYPDVALSKNVVCKFWNDMGKATSRIVQFMQNRTDNIKLDHHILVDGTLKSNESNVNTLSDFSRKARLKNSRDISVLYAFDLEEMEPVCSKCFPGNMIDLTSYESFISENKIEKGLLIGDKGFPSSAAEEYFAKHPDLHYLNPLKRNSTIISEYSMMDFTGMLKGHEGITFRKEKCGDMGKWLYSFRDASRAAKEEHDWLVRAQKDGSYSLDELKEKQKVFGTIVLECDLDMAPEVAYKAYDERWQIEIVMRFYKFACEFDEARVHDDYSVIGSEFCDFLSTLLTFRLMKKFDKTKLLEKMTYKKIMSGLRRAKEIRIGGKWNLIKLTKNNMNILQKTELITDSTLNKKNQK